MEFLRANPGYTRKFARYGLPPEEAYFRHRVLADWRNIRPHLPSNIGKVLDIGCGIAGLDLALCRGLGRARLFLVDKDRREQGDRSFDVLATAREFLAANGVRPRDIATLSSQSGDLHERLKRRRYDLVLSLRGLGYMFPYETYRETLRSVVAKDGRLILDIRLMDARRLKSSAVIYERFRKAGFPSKDAVIGQLEQDFGEAREIGRSRDYARVLVKRRGSHNRSFQASTKSTVTGSYIFPSRKRPRNKNKSTAASPRTARTRTGGRPLRRHTARTANTRRG